MKRLALALVVLGSAAAVLVPLGGAGAQAPGARTLTLAESRQGGSVGLVDNPPRIRRGTRRPILSPGDAIILAIPVTDEADPTRTGTLYIHCVVASPGTQARVGQLCTGSYKLSDGQLTLTTALVGSPPVITGVITGGDGAYAGARGSFQSENKPSGTNRDTITLLG